MKMSKADEQNIKKAKVAVNDMRKKFDAAEKKAMEHVKKNPEKALLIAAGVGAAIGAAMVYVLNKKKIERAD